MTLRLKRLRWTKGLFMGKVSWATARAYKWKYDDSMPGKLERLFCLRKVVEALRVIGAKPFVTDTVRIKGLDYLEVANQNGLNHLSVEAPVVLADGLYGHDNIMVKAGEIFSELAVPSLI